MRQTFLDRLRQLWWRWHLFLHNNRIGYCQKCECWTHLQSHAIGYSIASAWLCNECGTYEDEICNAAWAEFYAGRL